MTDLDGCQEDINDPKYSVVLITSAFVCKNCFSAVAFYAVFFSKKLVFFGVMLVIVLFCTLCRLIV